MEEADGNPAYGQSCYESSMNTTGLPWSTIETCFTEEYLTVQTAAMKATPPHDYVPWCLVDGTLVENTNLIQKYICDAYTGVKPQSCTSLLQEETSVCYNT